MTTIDPLSWCLGSLLPVIVELNHITLKKQGNGTILFAKLHMISEEIETWVELKNNYSAFLSATVLLTVLLQGTQEAKNCATWHWITLIWFDNNILMKSNIGISFVGLGFLYTNQLLASCFCFNIKWFNSVEHQLSSGNFMTNSGSKRAWKCQYFFFFFNCHDQVSLPNFEMLSTTCTVLLI